MKVPPELYSVKTGGRWLAADAQQGASGELVQGCREDIETFLLDCLTSHHLVILTGLGTSLSVNAINEEVADQKRAPTMSDLWNATKQELPELFLEVVDAVNYAGPPGCESIEILLSKCKMASELWRETVSTRRTVDEFIRRTEEIIRERCDFVSPSTTLTSHEILLQRVGRRSARKPRMKMFTLNYDRCFEEAAARLRFVVVDGFSHTIPQIYDASNFMYDIVRRESSGEMPDCIGNVFHFYKLHGSLDWTREHGEIVKREKATNPLLIYPRASKYEQAFEPPFLDMMSAFQGCLSNLTRH